MSRDSIPDDFDWVLAQSQCTSASRFDGLRTGVKEDVERRNGVLDPNAGWTFEFQEDCDDFEAVRLASGGSKVLALVQKGETVDEAVTKVLAPKQQEPEQQAPPGLPPGPGAGGVGVPQTPGQDLLMSLAGLTPSGNANLQANVSRRTPI